MRDNTNYCTNHKDKGQTRPEHNKYETTQTRVQTIKTKGKQDQNTIKERETK